MERNFPKFSIGFIQFTHVILAPFAAYCDGHLLVYSETHLDIFNTQTGEWVQSIGLKKSRPLSFNGNLSMMVMNDSPFVIYLANLHTRELFLNKTKCMKFLTNELNYCFDR